MRPILLIVLTLVVLVASLWLHGALRDSPQRAASTTPGAASIRARLDGLQSRIEALRRTLDARTDAQDESAARTTDPRLHAPRVGAALDEATLERVAAGLARLRAGRLQQDERRFVLRRLRELEIELAPDEEAAATGIVLAYFRAKTELWQSLRLAPRDPVTAQALYDDLTRAHHEQLAKVVSDVREAQVIASALMPMR